MERLDIAGTCPKGTRQPRTMTIQTCDEWKDVPYRPNPDCSVCNGAGFLHPITGGPADHSKTIPCRAPGCLLDSVKGKVLDHIAQQTFDTFIVVTGTDKAFKAARALASGEAQFVWLLIYGPTGNGKTHLCNATIRVVRDRGLEVRTIMAADLFAQLRESMRDNKTDELLRNFKDVLFLAIDDYGVEYGSDWERAKFDELMTSRYATAKPTMVITNMELADLPDRVRSRFQDKDMARAVHNSAPDFRRTKRG